MDLIRIKEAKYNFNQYIVDNLLRKENVNNEILKKFEDKAIESLVVAKMLMVKNVSPLWIIVTSYYAMFYIASAFVYKNGYKAQHKMVHKVISDALIVLSEKDIDKKILLNYEYDKNICISEQILDYFEYERSKRSMFQYETNTTIQINKAKTSFVRAQEFVDTYRKVIHGIS